MANCGRKGCHKCSEPVRCAAGNKCPTCKPAPDRQPLTKYEQDLKRIKSKR